MPTVIYLASVDWFFKSHFLHLARKARNAGYDVIVVTKITNAGTEFNNEGFSVVELPSIRGGVVPGDLLGAIARTRTVLRKHPDCILHGFGFFGVVVGAMAAIGLPLRRVFSITGRGYTAASRSLSVRLVGIVLAFLIRFVADGPNTRWLVENRADLRSCWLGRALRQGRVKLTRGAGVDPDEYRELEPPPALPPLKVAFVARLVWSKGLDIAVEATRLARADGADVSLTIAGKFDPGNPRTFTRDDIRAFTADPAIGFIGLSKDVTQIWQSHHIALLPSRGGEGVPRSLIEAVFCGRPLVTSDVPGCRTLARLSGGWIVPVDDARATADALIEAFARGGRSRVKPPLPQAQIRSLYSEAAVWRRVAQAYL
jgi:glycosyltransferase involved in cell wall biosynthesis